MMSRTLRRVNRFQGTGRQNPNSQIQTTGGTSQSVATTTNVQHFASGGLISAPTLSVIGDAPSGPEAVLPLGDERVMQMIGDEIPKSQGGAGAGNLAFNAHIKGGVIDSGTLKSVMRQMSKRTRKGTGLLTASNSHRITRRSA